jgi:hypothetical protein
MPAVVRFNDNCAETLNAIAGIRRNLNLLRALGRQIKIPETTNQRRRSLNTYTDFETMSEITPAAALVLASEYERRKILTGHAPWVINVRSWSPQVFKTLWEIGFFGIVGFPSASEPEHDDKSVVLQMRSGQTADVNAINSLIGDLKALYPASDQTVYDSMVHLYGAMIEAVGNVCGHAYPEGVTSQEPHVGRWWMTGAVDRRSRRTTAVIFDQGVSIPVSLPNWQSYAGWQRRIMAAINIVPEPQDPRSDGHAILTAVEESVSSTGNQHRGQGLAQMRNFVEMCRDGYLRIMSRNGEVVFRPGSKPKVRTYDVSVGGTLIEWNVGL